MLRVEHLGRRKDVVETTATLLVEHFEGCLPPSLRRLTSHWRSPVAALGIAWRNSPRLRRTWSGRSDIADYFSQVGDQVYRLHLRAIAKQVEVQQALMQLHQAWRTHLCQQLREANSTAKLSDKSTVRAAAESAPGARSRPSAVKSRRMCGLAKTRPIRPAGNASCRQEVLPEWDCDSSVDYVTIQHKD